MSTRTKLLCYLIALAGMVVFGSLSYQKFSQLSAEAQVLGTPPSETNLVAVVPGSTSDTNAPATNAAAAPPTVAAKESKPIRKDYSRLFGYGAPFFLCVVGFGFLFAHDISVFMGDRALKLLYNEEGDGLANPEYEQAEQVWANGEPLEAVRLMRDYLNQNPREVHVAMRIAEIYEKDLGNYLAAALEYEDILQKKLSPERWGWAAIHLCNLYSSKLNQSDKALELLRRIDAECGTTAPAEKARKRLAAYDAAGTEALNEEPRA